MARGRMISRAISLDERVNALSDDTARLLFTWLIAHLDCEGRMHGDAQTVKSIVFPRRKISARKVENYLKELQKKELIVRYSVNGSDYLIMKTFEKHQVGLQKHKEAQSQIPPCPPELLQSKDGVALIQVKTKIKEEVETKGSSSRCFTKEEIIDAYQNNITKDTDSISESMESEIDLAIKRFTAPWVIDAIREAVLHNKLTWVYVAGILKNWERYGKETR